MTEKGIRYHTEFDRRTRKVVAICTCGWRSNGVSSGGLAGALFDTHKEKEHQ